MKLRQSVSENCWIESSLQSTEKKEQSIFLMLPTYATDKENCETLSRVTSILVKKGWAVGDSQQLNNTISLEYILECDSNILIGDMFSCVPSKS